MYLVSRCRWVNPHLAVALRRSIAIAVAGAKPPTPFGTLPPPPDPKAFDSHFAGPQRPDGGPMPRRREKTNASGTSVLLTHKFRSVAGPEGLRLGLQLRSRDRQPSLLLTFFADSDADADRKPLILRATLPQVAELAILLHWRENGCPVASRSKDGPEGNHRLSVEVTEGAVTLVGSAVVRGEPRTVAVALSRADVLVLDTLCRRAIPVLCGWDPGLAPFRV